MSTTDRAPMRLREWLTSLGALCAGAMSREDAMARVIAYETALGGEYPPQAFTMASARHVARASKFWPSYGEVCDALSGWWRDNRSASDVAQIAGTTTPQGRAAESRVPYNPVWKGYAAKYGHLKHEILRDEPGEYKPLKVPAERSDFAA